MVWDDLVMIQQLGVIAMPECSLFRFCEADKSFPVKNSLGISLDQLEA